jgi:probable rRNA maturation factor
MRLRRRARRILGASVSTDAEWSVVLGDDEQVRQLNAQFRGKDTTTDVLSFALEHDDDREQDEGLAQLGTSAPRVGDQGPPPRLLGDVVVSVEQAARQAPDGDLEAELVRLLVHGICHLRGYGHQTRTARARMVAEERRLLQLFGLASGLVERGA